MEKLTKQDQDFVKEVAITGNQTQSAKNAYGIKSDDYARKKGSVQVAKGSINTAIQEVKRSLAERIPDELLGEKHLALLNKVDKEGNIDVQAVSKGLEMGYKIKGAYSEEATKPPVILMPILVKFLDKKDDTTSDNGDTE